MKLDPAAFRRVANRRPVVGGRLLGGRCLGGRSLGRAESARPSRGLRFVVALVCSVVFAATTALVAAPPASADAPGPTDYVTTIAGVEPSIDGIELEVIGGDSFILMRVEQGYDVMVLGYESEPYLWFRTDGEVLENRASPATWANQDRYGDAEPPEGVSASAEPRWTKVGEGGTHAWHDHRSHWMNPAKPLGAEPGDQILESAIPLIVSGRDVLIMVESSLLAPPPLWPAIAGLLFGGVAFVALLGGRGSAALVLIIVGGIAMLLGYTAFASVPSVTEPSLLLWLLPAIAVGAAALHAVLRKRLSTTVYLDGLLTAGGAALLTWGVTRFDGVRRALIPSDAPANLDRLVIVAALLVGVAVLYQGMRGLARPERLNQAPLPVAP